MGYVLSDLLTSDHPLLAKTIADFETASGNTGIDTRLIAEISETAHRIMRQLGIDPSDSSGEELYHALNAAVDSGTIDTLLSNSHFVLLRFPDGPVSFCLHDVIENRHHELPYAERTFGHAQRHLRAEIIKRYAQHDRTDNKMIHQLAELAGLKPEQDAHYSTDVLKPNSKRPHIMAIGDIFTDAFIKLSEDVVTVTKDENGASWVNIPFGGRPPYEEVEIVQSVGPSPNAAVSFAKLGLDSSLLSWLGDDKAGSDSLRHLSSEGVDTKLMSVTKGAKSNYYYVLRVGAERTILTKDEKYDYVWKSPENKPDWIYLASISEESWQLHEDLLKYLDDNKDIKLAFQPGTFHFKWGKDKLKEIFERTEIIILNREEAAEITGLSIDSISKLAEALYKLGPKQVVITDGPHGSYAYSDKVLVRMPNYPDPAPPYDRTGAGDAFASTIVAALATGETMETALSWAPINSMSVVQQLGAQAGLLDKTQIHSYLNDAPKDYSAQPFSD